MNERSTRLRLGKYSIGVGDRFARQAKAQLQACQKAAEQGVDVIPVWNKSNREHAIIGSQPSGVRAAAAAAVRELKWTSPDHVDADHINLETVDRFLESSDFFTLDVADAIGHLPAAGAVDAFLARHPEIVGRLEIPDIVRPLEITKAAAVRAVLRRDRPGRDRNRHWCRHQSPAAAGRRDRRDRPGHRGHRGHRDRLARRR